VCVETGRYDDPVTVTDRVRLSFVLADLLA
jgi:hypothetical protein